MVKVMGNFFAESLSDVGLVKLGKILEHFKVVVSGFVRHLSYTDSWIGVAQLSVQFTWVSIRTIVQLLSG